MQDQKMQDLKMRDQCKDMKMKIQDQKMQDLKMKDQI